MFHKLELLPKSIHRGNLILLHRAIGLRAAGTPAGAAICRFNMYDARTFVSGGGKLGERDKLAFRILAFHTYQIRSHRDDPPAVL